MAKVPNAPPSQGRVSEPDSQQNPAAILLPASAGPSSRGASTSGLPPLSPGKQMFLSGSRQGVRLSVDDLRRAATRLGAKHATEILVNGDGLAVARSQAAWRAAGGIDTVSDEEVHDATIVLANGLEPIFAEQLGEAAGGSHLALMHLGSERRSACVAAVRASPILRPLIENELAERVGLTPLQAADELQDLSVRARTQGRPLAFINVSKLERGNLLNAQGVDKGKGHSDAYIALPNGRVLNVVGYAMPSNTLIRDELMRREIAYASMELGRHANTVMPVHPQAGGDVFGCESLALGYVKEYLKDDCWQLKHSSLVLRGLPDSDSRGDSLMPSPEVLRFSQSARAVMVADAMMRETADFATVHVDDSSITVRTVAGLLRAGAVCEYAFGGEVPDLESVRQAWCQGLSTAVGRRGQMAPAGSHRNFYLAHLTGRYARA